jgi:hypothetical protein
MGIETVQPVRLQLSRQRGYRLQEASHAVNGLPAVVVRRPTRWGNPFNWIQGIEHGGEAWAKGAAVDLFEEWLREGNEFFPGYPTPPTREEIRAALRGKNLACTCKIGEACHADVLLRICREDEGGSDAEPNG